MKTNALVSQLKAVLVLLLAALLHSDTQAQPLIHYTFNDGDLTDISGYCNDGTLLGAANVVEDPERGMVLEIAGDGMFAEGPFPFTTAFTLSAWIKLDIPRSGRAFFGGTPWTFRTDNQGGSEHHWIEFRYPGLNFLDKFDTRTPDNADGQLDGEWHHYVFVLEESGVATTYFDGLSAPRRDDRERAHDYGGSIGNIFFGTQGETGPNGLSGYMDNIRVYNQALGADEVARLAEEDRDPVPLPAIGKISPFTGSSSVSIDGGITFKTFSDVDIATEDIRLSLNGRDVSSALSFSGDAKSWNVTYGESLAVNQVYNVEITVTNENGTGSALLSFDTIDPESGLVIEAEDYNFEGGKFFNAPVLCNDFSGVTDDCYFDRQSTPNIDVFDSNGGDDTKEEDPADDLATYRFLDEFETGPSGDTPRIRFVEAPDGTNGPIRDYDVDTLGAGDWANYTRTFPEGNYNVFLRAQAGSDLTVRLSKVSNPTTANQTADSLGTFELSSGGYAFTALTDAGQAASITLSGTETLRLTAENADNNLLLNYLLLVEATEAPSSPATLNISQSGTSIEITWDTSGTLQSATTLNGPFVDIADATSPYTTTANGTRFFRVQE